MGRWTAADPAGLVDGLDMYRYARANPIIFSDPSGNDSASAEALRKQLAEKKAYDAWRFSQRTAQNGRGLTPDQIGDIYKTVPQPDYAGPPTAEAANEQRYQLSYGEAKRDAARQEAAKNPAPTKQERLNAAKAGARNWLLDRIGPGLSDPLRAYPNRLAEFDCHC